MTTPDSLLPRLRALVQQRLADADRHPPLPFPPVPPPTTSVRERFIDAPDRRKRALARHSDGSPIDDATWERRQHRSTPQEDVPMNGDTIRRARHLTGLSQRQLATARNISRSWLADVERGRRGVPPELAVWATMILRKEQRAKAGGTP